MGTVIDSSVLIAAERGQLDPVPLLEEQPDDDFVVAAITVSELLHGLHRLGGVKRARAQAFIDRWLEHLPVVPFDLSIARTHATLAADLGARGARMGAHDLMIAATAVWLGYTVATRARRSFARLPDLKVLYW